MRREVPGAELYNAPECCNGPMSFTGGGCMGWAGELRFTTWECRACGLDVYQDNGAKLHGIGMRFDVEDATS